MTKKLAVWILERLGEISLVSLFLALISGLRGDSPGVSAFQDFKFAAVTSLYFYILSGYIVSCVLFGLIFRNKRRELHVSIFGAAFVLHCTIFVMIAPQVYEPQLLVTFGGGLLAVLISAFVGASILRNSGADVA